jgi:hypothetical protein
MTKLQKGGARFGRGPFNFFAFVSSDQINLGKLTGQDRHSRSDKCSVLSENLSGRIADGSVF